MAAEQVLQDEPHRRVIRIGATVRRPAQPWAPAVHALLGHLEAADFRYAPRFLGLDEQGREILSYIDGESGPRGWARITDDAGLVRFARLLRDYHDAVAGFRLPAGLTWFTGQAGPTDGELVCHGDFGPWNVVWDGRAPVGILDWDYARPAPPEHDIAYALEYAAPFRDDQECVRWLRYREPPDRRRRIEVFCDAYGIGVPGDIVGRVAEQQRLVLERCAALGRRGIEPQATWVREGYLGTVRARIRWTEALRL
jgi:Phosphotransferase enzyme family